LPRRRCTAGKADGIIVDGVGGGNTNVPFYKAIYDALDAGIPVVITSRHLGGQPHISKGYLGSLKSVMEKGAISGRYLTGIKARILLMVALAKTKDRKELADIFNRA
jgi:L-asparaginase